MCLELYCLASVFSGVFLVFQRQKTILFYYCSNLIGNPLACSLKTSPFLPDHYHSFPIPFLQCIARWLSSLIYLLCFCLWSLWLLISSFMYLKKQQPTFAGWRLGLPCWLSGEHLPILTPKPVAWVPRFVILRLVIFIMGSILWLHQTLGCFWSAHLIQMWPRTIISTVHK